MIGKEWCFGVTSVYIYDSGYIVLNIFRRLLNAPLKRQGKLHNQLPTLNFQLQWELNFNLSQTLCFLKFDSTKRPRGLLKSYLSGILSLRRCPWSRGNVRFPRRFLYIAMTCVFFLKVSVVKRSLNF